MAKKQQWAQDREASRICQNPFPRLFWTNLVSALRQKCSYYLLSSHKGTQPAPMSQCSGSICRNNRIVSSLQQQRLTKRFDFCQFHGHRAPRAWIIRQKLVPFMCKDYAKLISVKSVKYCANQARGFKTKTGSKSRSHIKMRNDIRQKKAF